MLGGLGSAKSVDDDDERGCVMKQWQVIPMREFSHLSVIRNEAGEVIATVQNGYAEVIQALPELLEVSNEIFENLRESYPKWDPMSPLGRLQKAINRIKSQSRSKE